MKKLRVIQAILVLFSALAITSCGDDITLDPMGGGEFTGSDLRVSYDNGVFVADEVTANVAGGAITFTATKGTQGEMLTMTLNETALSLSNPPMSIHAYNNVSMTYMESTSGDEYVNVNPETGESSGSIVITEVDLAARTISGYFAFVGYNPDAATAEPRPFYSGSFNNVVYTGDALPAPVPVIPVPEAQYLRATINEVEVNFGMVSAMPASGSLVLTGGTVNPLTSMNITVDEDIVPGIYNFYTSPQEGPYAVYNVGSTAHVSQNGTLQILTNSNGIIKGNFSFTAENAEGATIEVTEGEFNLEVN